MDYPELDSEKKLSQTNDVSNQFLELVQGPSFPNDITTNEKFNTLWNKLAISGYLSLNNPHTSKGIYLNTMQYMRVAEQFKFNIPFSISLLVEHYLVTEAISMYGSETIKTKYLPSLGHGEMQAVSCLREKSSDKELVPKLFDTRAELTDGGKHYKINGIKSQLMNVDSSKLLLVFANVDSEDQCGHQRSAAFLIDPNSPGVSFVPSQNCDYKLDGATNFDVVLTDVMVPVANRLFNNDNNRDLEMSTTLVTSENLLISALCLGLHKSLLDQYYQFVNSRECFGVPLFSYEKVKTETVQLCIDCFFSESTLYFLAGHSVQDPNRNFLLESMVTKTFCVESLAKWTDKLFTTVGHSGLIDESNLKKQRASRYLLHHQIPSLSSRLLIARSCIEHLLKEHDCINNDWSTQFLCSLGLIPDIDCYSTNGSVKPKPLNYIHPKLLVLANIYFIKLRKFSLFLKSLQQKCGNDLLNDKLFLYKMSTIILDTWTVLVAISRVSRAYCLNLPTHRHQFALLCQHFTVFDEKSRVDHADIIKYCQNRYDKNHTDTQLWIIDDTDNRTLPHPFDI